MKTTEERFQKYKVENYNSHANLIINTDRYLPLLDFWKTYKEACHRSGLDFKVEETRGRLTGIGRGKLFTFQAREKRRFFNLVATTGLYDGVNPDGFHDKVLIYSPNLWLPRNISSLDDSINSVSNKSLRELVTEFYNVLNKRI